jgi:MFS transporter, DHA3 family, macrolide efflux protein
MLLLAPLRHRPILLLWLGQTLSAIGDQFFTMAVAWTAAQRAGADVGVVIAAQYVSALVSGLFAGVYADRWDRRRTMISVDLLRAALVALLPLYALGGPVPLWLLVAVGAALQALGPLFDASLTASVPALLPDSTLLNPTNGLMSTTRRIARLTAPLLVATLLPIESLFTLDAISYLISALTVLLIGSGFKWRAARATKIVAGLRGVFADQAEGLRVLRARPEIFWAILSGAIPSVLWGLIFLAGIPLLAQREYGNDIQAYGFLNTAYGVGNVLGNIVLGSAQIKRRLLVLWLGHVVLALGFTLIGATPLLWLALLAAAFAALGGPMGDLMQTLLIQASVPPEHTGKAYAFSHTTSSAAMVLGLLLATPLYATFPTRPVFVVAGLLFALLSLAGMVWWLRHDGGRQTADGR